MEWIPSNAKISQEKIGMKHCATRIAGDLEIAPNL